MRLLGALSLILILLNILIVIVSAQGDTNFRPNRQIRKRVFRDAIGFAYEVVAYNATPMAADSTHRSIIKVRKYNYTQTNQIQQIRRENVQTIKFNPSLVDLDLDCQPTHCYLVVVTSKTKNNVELFTWSRTQFDRKSIKDSFARPHAVKLFSIGSSFYIAIAQEQLHLPTIRLSQEYEEPSRFIGCAILKFNRGHENKLKYHQFVKLDFNPSNVAYFISETANDGLNNTVTPQRHVSHHLVFSVEKLWAEPNSVYYALVWSPLNDYFWPYRFPRGAKVDPPRPGYPKPILKFPNQTIPAQTINTTQVIVDSITPIEYCFSQLQRIITEREFKAQRLIDQSKTLWRSSQNRNTSIDGLTNIIAPVIVHGNVIVGGSLQQTPQVTVFNGPKQKQLINLNQISLTANRYSAEKVDSRLKQAAFKLNYIRDKLSRAAQANLTESRTTQFNSRIKFYGPIRANNVIFKNNGILNSNVLLNQIPFYQLEHELIGLRGSQDVAARVVFQGSVTADLLEIHAIINDAFYLRDALDVTSNNVQIIDGIRLDPRSQVPKIEFQSIVTQKPLALSRNSTINGLRLEEFVTRDSRTQFITGRKTFSHLSMSQLDLSNPNVLLNDNNISNIALNSLYIREPRMQPQVINAERLVFTKPVSVARLIINGPINRHINISSLIIDSVKRFDNASQQIYGHKYFTRGLKINRLTTEGSINDVRISQVFNLNPIPPVPDHSRYFTGSIPVSPITGNFVFANQVDIGGSFNVGLLNGINISRNAVRRLLPGDDPHLFNVTRDVLGRKTFARPLHIINQLRLNDSPRLNVPPLVNGFNLRLINAGLNKLAQNPPVMQIDNLEIEGNLNIDTVRFLSNQPRLSAGNLNCPLDVFRKKTILAGGENQFIEAPIKVESLRSRSVYLEPRALNGMTFPEDFVLRLAYNHSRVTEAVYGSKLFDRLQFASPLSSPINQMPDGLNRFGTPPQVVFGSAASINSVAYNELQEFIHDEQQRNSTGETIYQNLTVFGNVYSERINGYKWPDDIILKSVGQNVTLRFPSQHRRIYSPIVFSDPNNLEIVNQLVLRGPIQLDGRLNGVNLSDFARQSVTYGDKDLLSINRPIRNKVFLGGITVNGEIRSQGLIDGININDFWSRAVTTDHGPEFRITGPKTFLSDVNFLGPVITNYLNDLFIDQYLRRMRIEPDNLVRIFGKKTVTGALRIHRDLTVQGNINGINNFVDLHLRAISLSPNAKELNFNKTLTIEGDVFIDNLSIDERNGTINGIRLTNLLPIQSMNENELVISNPALTKSITNSGQQLNIAGFIHDREIACKLMRTTQVQPNFIPQNYTKSILSWPIMPQKLQQRSMVTYPPRPVQYNGRNVTIMRTPPPYAGNQFVEYKPPDVDSSQTSRQQIKRAYPDQRMYIRNLAVRRPISIQYERSYPIKRYIAPQTDIVIRENIDVLRRQIISLNLIQISSFSNIVVGFIESPLYNFGNMILPGYEALQANSRKVYGSSLQLDEIDYLFKPLMYHLSVGVSTIHYGQNITRVSVSVGGSNLQPSILPVEAPNSAMFCTGDKGTLFLLVSQDYRTFVDKYNGAQCPRYSTTQSVELANIDTSRKEDFQMLGSVHVYLFYILQNSSSFAKPYFDLYQTIDLPAIDSFDKFKYQGSTYALAVSRLVGKIYLLMLRGYSGFQIVSSMDAPGVQSARIANGPNKKPTLIINQANGRRIMESVII